MPMCSKRGSIWRAAALLVVFLSLTVATAGLSGCAAGNGAGAGAAPPGSFPECMAPSNPLPWWQTYPCNLLTPDGR